MLQAGDGTRFRAALARAPERPARAAVVVLPDARGLQPFYEELAARFANVGADALALDWYGRSAGTDPRPAGWDHRAHSATLTWEHMAADLTAAAAWLRRVGDARVVTVGFCLGGRASLLAATLEAARLAGAVSFYGAVTGTSRGRSPAPIDLAAAARCPLLAIFGGADELVPLADVDAYAVALRAAGTPHEVVVYSDAPHSFFDRHQPAYAAASANAWQRVLTFLNATKLP